MTTYGDEDEEDCFPSDISFEAFNSYDVKYKIMTTNFNPDWYH